MEELIYESVFRALAHHQVRYLVAGGVAVILHGWARFTKDLDLMLDLKTENVLRFVSAMRELRFKPHVPVPLEDLADSAKREKWRREKGALVLNLGHLDNPLERIDVFLSNPVDFETAFGKRKLVKIRDLAIGIVSLEELIAMKQAAGRPQDLEDIRMLGAVQYRRQKE